MRAELFAITRPRRMRWRDIRQRDTLDWPEPARWVADQQQGIGINAGDKPRGLHFLLELQTQPRQSRTTMF